MISAFFKHYISGVKSPLSYTTDFLIFAKRGCQSLSLYLTRAFRGAI